MSGPSSLNPGTVDHLGRQPDTGVSPTDIREQTLSSVIKDPSLDPGLFSPSRLAEEELHPVEFETDLPATLTKESMAIDESITVPSRGALDASGAQVPPSTGMQPDRTTPGKINKSDALDYLDQVKAQFSTQPDIYVNFLEIMKDFKAQSITTESVVERVSTLFHGFPGLIEGFNQFLPQEYRIRVASTHLPEVKKESTKPLPYIGHPSTSGSNPFPSNYSLPPINPSQATLPRPQRSYLGYSTGVPYKQHIRGYTPAGHHGPPKFPHTPTWSTEGLSSQGMGQRYTSSQMGTLNAPYYNSSDNRGGSTISGKPSFVSSSSSHVPTGLNALGIESMAPQRKASMGMIQAVGYLRKIQERFFKQPEVYHAFVDILRSYQRDQKSIVDVFSQVSHLFGGSNSDLLDEFMQFIPDSQHLRSNTHSSSSTGSTFNDMPGPFSSPSFASAESTGLSSNRAIPMHPMKTHSHPKGGELPAAPDYMMKRPRLYEERKDLATEELEFFGKVKRHLNHNEQLYSEFLKCLNCYTQGILSKPDLLRLVHGFIGKYSDLYAWFKQYIGGGGSGSIVSSTLTETEPEKPSESTESEKYPDAYSLDLSSCKRIESYRFLPKNYQHPVCSGRSDLCHEVLNDLLVSCPSFNSEDSTFISSKKNAHEEALFRCEDERYELDLLIDTLGATLAVFEPLLKKIEYMSASEAEKFILGDNLGGSSEVIYRNVLRRIYGNHSDEILEGLKRTPITALPIVVARLKQKDEEWRMAQREWNRIWRDVHFKNYYKALDHQGIHFRATDKKIISVKSLLNELQTVYHEQLRGYRQAYVHLLPSSVGLVALQMNSSNTERSALSRSLYSSGLPNQLEFHLADVNVLEDLLQLGLYMNVKLQSASLLEKRSLEKFLLHFLPDFFSLRATLTTEFQERFVDESLFSDASLGDLSDFTVKLSPKTEPSNDFIFGNDHMYAFFRLFQIAYHRLCQMKQFSRSFQDNPIFYHKRNQVASYLEVQKKAPGAPNVDADYYSVLLELIRQVIEGSMEASLFEEKVRLMFGPNAYLMFTFDRVLYSWLRHTLSILGDDTTEHLVALHDSYRRSRSSSSVEEEENGQLDHHQAGTFSEYAYKTAARSLIGNEAATIVRIEAAHQPPYGWALRFRLLPLLHRHPTNGGHDGDEEEELLASEANWMYYIDQFIDVHYDPVLLTRKPPLVLLKYLKGVDEGRLKDMTVRYNLECKICVRTFKMFFVNHSEDFILYKDTEEDDPKARAYPEQCVEKFRQWLASRAAT